jgi:hypothetical protein
VITQLDGQGRSEAAETVPAPYSAVSRQQQRNRQMIVRHQGQRASPDGASMDVAHGRGRCHEIQALRKRPKV